MNLLRSIACILHGLGLSGCFMPFFIAWLVPEVTVDLRSATVGILLLTISFWLLMFYAWKAERAHLS